MKRRSIVIAAASLPVAARLAWAHHGWSSFDQDRPIYLEGKVVRTRWQNPHAELVIEVPAGLKLPADLATRTAAGAERAGRRRRACWPRRPCRRRNDRQWELELAPLTRMEAWKVAEIKPGTAISAVGFTIKDEKGEAGDARRIPVRRRQGLRAALQPGLINRPRAASARCVISSTVPTPLMARYFGAAAGSALAQAE